MIRNMDWFWCFAKMLFTICIQIIHTDPKYYSFFSQVFSSSVICSITFNWVCIEPVIICVKHVFFHHLLSWPRETSDQVVGPDPLNNQRRNEIQVIVSYVRVTFCVSSFFSFFLRSYTKNIRVEKSRRHPKLSSVSPLKNWKYFI